MLRIVLQGVDRAFDLVEIRLDASGDDQIVVGNLYIEQHKTNVR